MEEKSISVNQAIATGHRWINYPVLGIFLASWPLTWWLLPQFLGIHQGLALMIGGVVGFLIACAWWIFTIAHWRIWAFSKVENVHELKYKAINQRLIWPDGSKYNKMEFRTQKQQRLLKELEKKFEAPLPKGEIWDDGSVPYESYIYYSIFGKLMYVVLSLLIATAGVYQMFTGHEFLGLGMLIVLFFIIKEGGKFNNKHPQITLNEDGIVGNEMDFISWEIVEEVILRQVGIGKDTRWFLDLILVSGDYSSIELFDFNMSKVKIEELARLYLQRYRENKAQGRKGE